MNNYQLLLSCEHAENMVPPTFRYLFSQAKEDLNSHRGWDPGALKITKQLAKEFDIGYYANSYSRLLIDVNRSQDQYDFFSEYTIRLNHSVKDYLINKYYKPFREEVTKKIESYVGAGQPVLHLSVHTFTPIWEGVEREVDIGLLMDKSRKAELRFCQYWLKQLEICFPDHKIKLNQPYDGASDGFTTYLRSKFSSNEYLGIELEVNQKFVNSGLKNIVENLSMCLKHTLSYEYCGN